MSDFKTKWRREERIRVASVSILTIIVIALIVYELHLIVAAFNFCLI